MRCAGAIRRPEHENGSRLRKRKRLHLTRANPCLVEGRIIVRAFLRVGSPRVGRAGELARGAGQNPRRSMSNADERPGSNSQTGDKSHATELNDLEDVAEATQPLTQPDWCRKPTVPCGATLPLAGVPTSGHPPAIHPWHRET